jgi:Spy/CpxP family protein refolding chaperone
MKAATPFLASPAQALRLFLGALLLAVLGGIALTALAEGGPPMHGGHDMMMMGPLGGRGLDHMLDSVNATDAQRQQIKQIMQSAQADLKAQHESAKSLHEQAMTLFTQPVVDANAAEALRQQMLAQHDQASKRMLQAMLDISRVLTPEQRQQLAAHMKQRHEQMQQRWQEHHHGGDDDAPPPPPQQ